MLEDHISKAKALARSGKKYEALQIANELVTYYPGDFRVWDLRGYIHGLIKEYESSIADFTRAIDIKPEAILYFKRGIKYVEVGDNESAIKDFTKCLEEETYGDESYRYTVYFWRAEAFINIGAKEKALSDLIYVPDDFSYWTYKLRTKADLMKDCTALK